MAISTGGIYLVISATLPIRFCLKAVFDFRPKGPSALVGVGGGGCGVGDAVGEIAYAQVGAPCAV